VLQRLCRSHCVWPCFRFCLSYRDVEELMATRGILLTYEAVRSWCRKFGQAYANQLHRWHPKPSDKWHLDKVFLTIHGERHSLYLWRAVDQDGHGLEILEQHRRNKKATKEFFRKLFKRLAYVPRVIITGKLTSYGAAKREVLPGVKHRQHRCLINRAENSHQPTHQRERRMQRFKSPGHAQTLPLRLRAHRLPLPPQTSPAPCPGLPPGNETTIPGVARDYQYTNGRLREECGVALPPLCLVITSDSVNLTRLGRCGPPRVLCL
jgi:putative transposase